MKFSSIVEEPKIEELQLNRSALSYLSPPHTLKFLGTIALTVCLFVLSVRVFKGGGGNSADLRQNLRSLLRQPDLLNVVHVNEHDLEAPLTYMRPFQIEFS